MKSFIQKNHLFLIVLAGFLFRLFFYFVGAKIYYGTPDFYVGGDRWGWVSSSQNLIDNGTYFVLLGESKSSELK